MLYLRMVASVILGVSASPAYAENTQSHMKIGSRTSQPIGHYNYCKQYSSDCKIKARTTAAPELTRKRWKDMVEVNSYSNNTITPLTDMEAYNVEELWTYPKSYGDCEDYVLMKRHMLMQRGWPASSLLITVVRQPNGEGHAVLTVRTDRADYILDNLDDKIYEWADTPYTYLKRQSQRHSGHWIDIFDNRPGKVS
jgi:predicted transglutaminase-like cysteine proteinase